MKREADDDDRQTDKTLLILRDDSSSLRYSSSKNAICMDRVIKMNQYDKMNGMVYTEPVFRSTWPFMKSSSLYEKESKLFDEIFV